MTTLDPDATTTSAPSTASPTPDVLDPELSAQATRIVSGLARADKVRLLSGAGMWATEAVPGASSVLLANGPNGVGKQASDGDHVGIGATVPATCFPSGSTLGSTWDPALLEEVGAAMGREARAEGVGVLLGPGLNIKRHPGGGRVFEYLSEDPFLSGKLAAALVRGVQSQGVGASVKHFAANNQETCRMRMDSVVDERTLREIYLAGFEIVVRESAPWTVMTSYNLVNGEHTGESRRLVTEILRDEWGFDGLVMSDWGAVYDRPAAARAGLDLEMPGGAGPWDARLVKALETGALAESDLDRAAGRVVALALRVEREQAAIAAPVDRDVQHELARRAAAAGFVLLRNDGLLPLSVSQRLAVIGAGGRFQGAGSSHVNPWQVDDVLDALRDRFDDVQHVRGYDPATGSPSADDLAAAVRAAADAQAVVLLLSVPAGHEAEGVDRRDLSLPAGTDALVRAVTSANPRTVVVLANGAPVELPWAEEPAALLETYLGGQAAGTALADVLVGASEPGGRLAESFAVAPGDLAAALPDDPTQTLYRENLYVGYRFHDTFGVPARFPFGHGLGYTTFEYGDVAVVGEGTERTVRVPVTNTGSRPGSEVVQVYVHDVASTVHRPEQELKGFAKVHLVPGETRTVEVPLDRRSFAVYDVAAAAWLVEGGEFEVRVGSSSTDRRGAVTISVASHDVVTPVPAPAGPVATDAELAVLLGRPVPTPRPLLPFTTDSTIDDLRLTWLGRRVHAVLATGAAKQLPADADEDLRRMIDAIMGGMPLRAVVGLAGGKLSFDTLDRLIRLLNVLRRR